MNRRALVASALAGLTVGLVDALASWGQLGQFVPGAGGKLHAALLSGALVGLVAALLGPLAVAGASALVRFTALGRVKAAPLTLLSLVLAGLPALGGALAIAYRIGYLTATTRKHQGLVVVVVMAATIVALLGAAVVTLALGRLVERALARIKVHRMAPLIVGVGLLVVAGIVAYVTSRKVLSLDQVALRPIVVALLIPLAMLLLWRPADRAPRFFWGLPLVFLGLVLLLGAAEGPRKAVNAFTGLGGPITTALQRLADFDRDGYSRILGGGDCDDLDRDVHPGAFDFPDDGVDQNCMGGDLRLTRAASDVGYVPLPASVPPDTNIVFITVDALRADHLGAYGYSRPTSPALDAIAAEGTVFVNGWAHAPSTRYSVPAILTGRYPSQVLWDPNARDESWWPGLQLGNTTLAELAKAGGLTTAAFTSYRYFNRVRRMDQGFDVYDNSLANLHAGADPAKTEGSSARELADKAVQFISEQNGRFFLWVHFYDPHYSYQRHPGTTDFGPSEPDLYDQEIRFTDDQIARIVAELKARGLYDRTIFVVTGDHGEGFGEHKITFHGYHLYAAQTRVPFIIRVPGLPAQRAELPVGHVDLLPTIGNLVGGSAESTMVGRSLVSVLAGKDKDADRDVYQEVSYENNHERRAVATKRWHLLFNMSPENTWELYDLAADPLEARDVWGSADVGALRERLLSWIDATQFLPGAAEKLASAISEKPRAAKVSAQAELGGKIRLYGYDLPASARIGDAFEAVYHFQSLGHLDGDWRLFIHIEGPGFRFQDDHAPVDGVYPFARWKEGVYVADARTVTVPANAPPGEYTVFLGIWRPGKGTRLAVVGGEPDNRVRLGTIQITR